MAAGTGAENQRDGCEQGQQNNIFPGSQKCKGVHFIVFLDHPSVLLFGGCSSALTFFHK
jgi:hypothetical protein